ncbi:MAG: NUDIX hydrolase, partial [Mycobacteriales bacterium]
GAGMMRVHSDAVQVLSRLLTASVEQQALRDEFLRLLAARVDGVSRECVPSHITASAIVLDAGGDNVLLALHRKVGLWLQMGGHCEDADETLSGAALREATEESGIPGLCLLPDPIDLDKHAAPCAPGVAEWHFDVRFLAVAAGEARPTTSEESLDVRWFPVDALPSDTVPDMPRLIATARAALRAG